MPKQRDPRVRTLFDKVREYGDPLTRSMSDLRREAEYNAMNTLPAPSPKPDATKSMIARTKNSKLSKAMGTAGGGKRYRRESSYSMMRKGMTK